MRIIVLLNHQYATGKTTAAWYLGHKMAEMGRNVLLVDGDPACGLTRMALGDEFEGEYGGVKRIDNIKKGVKAAFKGKSEAVRDVECRKVCEGLYLLPGHENLSEYEPQLRDALDNYSPYSMDKDIPGSFYRLFEECAERYEIDYILLDTGGGLGALNQIFFTVCDACFIPLRASSFMDGMLKTLKKTVKRWKREAEEYRDRSSYSRYPLPCDNAMQLAGYIVRLPPDPEYARKFLDDIENTLSKKPVFPVPGFLPGQGDAERADEYRDIAEAVLSRED